MRAQGDIAPASRAFIAVCWKGSRANGYCLAGGPALCAGGRQALPSSTAFGQETSCVQALPPSCKPEDSPVTLLDTYLASFATNLYPSSVEEG